MSTTFGQPKSPVSVPPLSGNISGVAPEGDIIGNSIANDRCSAASQPTMNPPPPRPFIHGSATPIANAVATAASIALPPAARISRPMSTATDILPATAPPVPRAGERVTESAVLAGDSERVRDCGCHTGCLPAWISVAECAKCHVWPASPSFGRLSIPGSGLTGHLRGAYDELECQGPARTSWALRVLCQAFVARLQGLESLPWVTRSRLCLTPENCHATQCRSIVIT